MDKLVSVVVPLYNCKVYLEKCLNSVIEQTYSNLEIIISDDCSTDGSYEVAKQLADRDNRIQLYKQPKNIGLLENYNFLFKTAKGAYITIQDADDWSDPDRLEKQVNILNNSHYLFCGTGCIFHYPKNKDIVIRKAGDEVIEGPTLDYKIVPASLMFRKQVLDLVNGYHPYFNRGTSMDRYFINCLLQHGKGYYIDAPLYHANVRPFSNHKTISTKRTTTEHLVIELIKQKISTGSDWLAREDYKAISDFEKTVLANKKIMSEEYRTAAVFNTEFKQHREAFDNLVKSFRYNINTINIRTLLFFIRSKFLSQ